MENLNCVNSKTNQMKQHFIALLAAGLACLAAGLVPVHGQVIVNPNIISGHVRFSNANAGILNLLNSPGNEGLSNVVMLANSVPPAPPIAAYSDSIQATNRTVTSYQLTVDSANPGIAYALAPYVVMQGDQYVYYFNTKTSAPVVIGTPPPALDFDECVGVVTVQFVTSGGAPIPVDGGKIIAYSLPDYNYAGVRSVIAAGSTEQRIYLRGGLTHQLDITVHRGTNFYTDRLESFLSTNVAVACDTFTTVKMVLPDSTVLASIIGSVDMLGEFELTAASNPLYDYPNYTTVIASSGPFSNQRWGALPGLNFTTPSSGDYTLSNVVPSTLDPLSAGYWVSAQMLIRTNRMIQVFQTPGLNSGLNPPLPVAPGATVDLTNLFEINPGYLRGRVLLQGPAESLGRASLLRGVLHAGDDDLDDDGIPDAFGTYGVYWTTVEAVGVDRLAAGATFTASGGLGYGDFPGDFNPATSAYEGQYELALGGLLGEASIWKQKYFNLTFVSSPSITNDDDYFANILSISEDDTNDVQIVPGQAVTNDVAYCLSEVKVVFHSTSGTFYQPNIRFSSGSFTGTDFQGRAADYSVDVESMYGTPTSSATASNIGQVVMYLPQGIYHLNPSVTPAGGNAQAGLEPIDITVGCGQRLTLEPCLQLSLQAPAWTNSPTVHVSGSVRSCGSNVTHISYTLNSGPVQTICSGCGADPSFAFTLHLSNECTDNLLVVTATDSSGGVSSVTTVVRYDGTPPDINCPADITAVDADTNGTNVNFTVTATDNCAGPVSLVCTPPSGSLFPLGTNTVTCTAADTSGNTNSCSFLVIVRPPCVQVSIEPPMCTTNYGFIGWGSATSCDGTLTNLEVRVTPEFDTSIRLTFSSITYFIGSTNFLRIPGQIFPEFDGFPPDYYTNMLWTVTVRDNHGGVFVRQEVFHYDFTPPVLNCPGDITVTAADGVSAVVNYSFTADDGCTCPVIARTIPPSGSSFSVGTHTVTCIASDLCHNTNTCTFQVTVLPPECPLRIELTQSSPPEVTLTWDCDAALQSAPDVAGPWSNVAGAASPFVTAAVEPQTFYRLKFSSAGAALQFPGTGSAFATASVPNYFAGSSPALTIAAWLKTSQSTGAYPGIITKYLGGSASGYALALNAGRLAPWYYYDATHFIEPGFSGPTDRFVADNLWHHVAFVVDATSGRTFIDGQLVSTQPWTGSPVTSQSNEPLRFGTYPGGAGKLFNGQLDEVTLWSIALTDSQINALMTAPPLGAEPGLQGYWRFDENGGSTAYDWTGHGYDASLGAGVTWTKSTAPITP